MHAFITTSACALGLAAPKADASEKKAAPVGSGVEAEQRTDTTNCEPLAHVQQDARGLGITSPDYAKRLATAKARLALAGFSVHDIDGVRFLVARWNRADEVADLADLEAFAGRVGGRQ
jgi:hypothetical protein